MASLLGGALSGGREYVLKIIADVKDAIAGVDKVQTATTGFKQKAVGIGKSVATGLAVAAVADFGMASINAAADAEDANDMIVSAFGGSSKEVQKFAKSAAKNMGLSITAYENMAGKTGQILTGYGINQKDAAQQTSVLAQRAADMSAIFNTDVPTAMDAMDKAMQGNMRSLRQFGIEVTNDEINTRAMSLGYTDASGKVTEAGKAIAAQQIILEKTAKYQGEYAKNSEDLGAQQDQMRAQFENLKITIGEALLPVVIKLFDVIKPFIEFVSKNSDWLVPLALGITAVVTAVKLWTAAQWLLNIALNANPISLIIIGIAALVAAIIWAYNNVEWFHNLIQGLWEWIQEWWPVLLGVLLGPFAGAAALVWYYWDEIWEFFKGIFGWFSDTWQSLWEQIQKPFLKAWDIIYELASSVGDVWYKLPDDINKALSGLSDIITYPFKVAWNWIYDNVFKPIGDFFYKLPGQVNTFLGNLDDYITYPFKAAWNWIYNSMFQPIGDFFYRLPGRIQGFFSGLADIITWPFRKAFDGIKWLWNSTIGGFGFTVPSWVPFVGGKDFRIPEMAAGGIVNRPTIALLGEAGPEAVVPLNRLTAASSQASVTLNVYALTANSEVGRLVYNALRDYERTSGDQIFNAPAIPSGF